ncbi:MAG: AGE family epimerase/isomerase [Candidatus Goldbacteria bacterium]|nr:AGE family epimerase/isomerase [Candidatus Goldiibacteriota bacterium]
MKKFFYFVSVFFLTAYTIIASSQTARDVSITTDVSNPEYWKSQALTDLIPFWENTIDRDDGGFYTDVEENGSVWGPGKKYPRMISRVIFGFCTAYLLSGDDKYLEYAKHGMDYLTNYGWDKENSGWFTYVDESGEPDDWDKNLFDQAYCNLGPILYYFVTADKNALSLVEKTHNLMQTKAWDKKNGGYYSKVGKNWEKTTSTKSFNAQIDTCTAYLIYYYLATKNKQLLNDLKSISDVVIKRMVDPVTGFVGEYFGETWEPLEHTLWTGHNLKTAWVLARMFCLTGNEKYLTTAKKIADSQIKYTWDKKNYGWFFKFNGKNPSSIDDSKDWWTQEEGNNLMVYLYHCTGNKDYFDKFLKGAYFWDKYFIDRKYSECYQTLSADGTPKDKVKGTLYKSAYHSMEQAFFLYLYLSLFVNKGEATLYFNLNADEDNKIHYVNPLEDSSVYVKKIEINGKEWNNFDKEKCCVLLPAGKNLKLKVVLGVK